MRLPVGGGRGARVPLVAVPRTIGANGRRWGRRVLWAVLLLTFGAMSVRGLSDWFRKPVAPVTRAKVSAERTDAGGFAAQFATLLLTYSPARVDEQRAQLEQLVSSRVDVPSLLTVAGGSQRVTAAWPGATRTAGHRSDVTVMCVVARDGRTRIVRLSVPVAEDGNGGISVDGYPALMPPPPAAAIAAPATRSLTDEDATAIAGPLERTLRQYLGGGPVIPELLTPGTVIQGLGQRLALVSVDDLSQVGAGTATSRKIVVKLTARDPETRALHTFSYLVGVKFRDRRWLVDSLNG